MASLGSSECWLRDTGGGSKTGYLKPLLGCQSLFPRQHPILINLPPVSKVGGSVEVDEADCFVTTGSSGCTREGTLLTSSIKHQSCLLESEHTDTHGATQLAWCCSARLTDSPWIIG